MEIKIGKAYLTDAIRRLETFASDIENANYEIVNDLVSSGKKYGSIINASAPQSGTETSQVVGEMLDDKTGVVSLTGRNAVYDEFGTGEEGAANSHPLHSSVTPTLNPYNSGPVVSTHINDGTLEYGTQWNHYWYYKPMAGKPYFYGENGYTEGIPSGQQMFKTSIYLHGVEKNVVAKHINDAIKKYK